VPRPARPPARAPANRVRIIGGAYRSRVLRFPAGLPLRPTPDRVRETLFNWLGQDLTGKSCLDLFAGSGALGFEAASRGAARVVMVERDRNTHDALLANQRLLNAAAVRIAQGDALEFLRRVEAPRVEAPRVEAPRVEAPRVEAPRVEAPFDIVFLDPPYAFTGTEALLQALRAHLHADALVYREGADFLPSLPGWTEHRRARAGAVHYQLLKANHG